jgi:uncharacterized delta-60 repeat protein
MSTNFLIRVIRKAFTFILIPTFLTLLIVIIHASDALSLDTAGDDVGSGIALQSDDKIVVVGTSDSGSGFSEFAVARFNVNGSLDTTFSGDGKVTTGFSAGDDVGSGIAVQSDDKIVVVGTSELLLWAPVTTGAAPRNLRWHVSTPMAALTTLLAAMVRSPPLFSLVLKSVRASQFNPTTKLVSWVPVTTLVPPFLFCGGTFQPRWQL